MSGRGTLSAPGRRLSRGLIELRGRTWWNRYREEHVDQSTGAISRRSTRMKLGTMAIALGRRGQRRARPNLALQSAETLSLAPRSRRASTSQV